MHIIVISTYLSLYFAQHLQRNFFRITANFFKNSIKKIYVKAITMGKQKKDKKEDSKEESKVFKPKPASQTKKEALFKAGEESLIKSNLTDLEGFINFLKYVKDDTPCTESKISCVNATKLLVCYLVRAGKDPIIGFQNANKSSLIISLRDGYTKDDLDSAP